MCEWIIVINMARSVVKRLDFGCRGIRVLDMTAFFRSLPEGEWTRRGISLSCFRKLGVNLAKVTTPLVLISTEPFAVTFRDARVIANASDDSLISCS